MSNDVLLVDIPSPLSYSSNYAKYLSEFAKFTAMLKSVDIPYAGKMEERKEDDIEGSEQKYSGYYSIHGLQVIICIEQFLMLVEQGCQPIVISRHKPKDVEATLLNVETAVLRLEARLAEAAEKMPEFSYNSKCDVHVPGLGLMILNETMLLEDSCTDQLQTALDNGWRIVAACPQPDSRRPDYVLGRYNPERDQGDSSATRDHRTK
jgi:hypothetical protein